MRKTLGAFVLTVLATLGALAPGAVPAVAAATQPKAVIVVGPVEANTSNYRSNADRYYTELRKFTSNVTRIYSPNATWAAVKPALQGASIVIYLGHGNGFPSPYRTTPWPYSQNGFGLNKVANSGDSNVTYYGEYYVGNDITLAPNAVVLLNRLCYASGNDEGTGLASSVSVAQQRVDNYGAGFIKAGARAVIADGVGDLVPYIDQLFTTHRTIDQIWRSAPNFNNRVIGPVASLRSPGLSYQLDPNSKQQYYRSVVGDLALTADKVTGAAYAPTDVDPSSLVVPGAASVASGGAGVYGDATLSGTPVAQLPADTGLRVNEAVPPDTSADVPADVYQVQTLDGKTVGYTPGSLLVPRDSLAPQLWTLTDGGGTFDPGDPAGTGFTLAGRFSESAAWRITIRSTDGSTVLFDKTGTGQDFSVTWSGKTSSGPVPNGTYPWTINASDPWLNVMPTSKGSVVVDDTVRRLAAGSSYTPIDPVRLLDTRSGNGLSGAFVSGTPRTFTLAGRGGIPADAVAVSANLTVTGQTSGGYLSVGPTMTSSPATSTLNFPTSDTRANGVVVRLGANGTLGVVFKGSVGAKAHVVLDVTGYYRLGSDASLFTAVAPARVLDTRIGNGLSGPFEAATPRSFQVAGAGGVPADAVAVTGNLTVTNQTSGGYLSLGPTMTSTPSTSTLNFPAGDTRANNVVVRLDADGALGAVYMAAPGATVQVVFDVTGYYRAGSGSLFVPIDPVRLLDTRSGNGLTSALTAGTARSFGVAGRASVPSGSVAVTGNLTVTNDPYGGYLSLGPTMTSTPSTSTLNFPARDTRANGIAMSLGGSSLGIVYKGPSLTKVDAVLDVTGYFKAPA